MRQINAASGGLLALQRTPHDLHREKLEYYRNRETYYRSRMDGEPQAAERSKSDAAGWARLAELRRLVQAKQADTNAVLAQIARR